MFGIKYNGIFLDIVSKDLESEYKSPLFMADDFAAENSIPFSLPCTEKNVTALGGIFFEHTVKKKTKLDVEIYEQYTYTERGTLVVESAGMNNGLFGKASASGYLLTNVSSFFSDIQLKKMSQLNYGGLRIINYTTSDPTDGSTGYWQEFQQTWNFGNDYIVLPVRNENIDGNTDIDSNSWMNEVRLGKLDTSQNIYPFIKLKYALECCFKEHGWSIDFSDLNDTDWEKLILFSAYMVETSKTSWIKDDHGWSKTVVPNPVVIISLANCFDNSYTVSQFIVAVCKKYGWAPLCNGNTKTCRMAALKEIKSYDKKDWTLLTWQDKSSDFKDDIPVYAFKNNFGGNDSLNTNPDTTGFILGYSVPSRNTLPVPSASEDNKLYYAELENQYYKLVIDDTTNVRVWGIQGDNIGDYEPEGNNASIDSDINTLPVYWTQIRSSGGTDYYGLFPTSEQSRTEAWGLRTLFYHGLVYERNGIGSGTSAGTYQYPFASCSRQLPNGDVNASGTAWDNFYKSPVVANSFGIVDYWFSLWLSANNNYETVTKKINVPFHELMNFKWDSIILDNNIPFLIKSFIRKRPYTGYIQAVCRRINLANAIATQNIIYLKIIVVATQEFDFYTEDGIAYSSASVVTYQVLPYTDVSGNDEYITDATGLVLNYEQVKKFNGALTSTTDKTLTLGKTYNSFLTFMESGNKTNPPLGYYESSINFKAGDKYIII